MAEPTWDEENWSPEARQALIAALDRLSAAQLRSILALAFRVNDTPQWFHMTLVAALKVHIERIAIEE